jgi:hypothetical protein
MEETRGQIRSTVEELKDKVNETLDWRHYVDRYPGTSLTVAVALGMLLGRGLGSLVRRNGEDEAESDGNGAYRTAESYGEAGFTAAASAAPSRVARMAESAYASAEPALSGARRAVGQSVSRLGSRAEGILNRVIDELTDAVESTLIPALTTRFRNLLDVDRRSSQRHEGGEAGGGGRARWEEPAREERGGVYPGGPAGTQHYPSQGRAAEQV